MSAEHPEQEAYGLGLRPGSPHYRAYVGPPVQYDVIAGLQFGILFQAGLRETHKLLDLGCGSLRAGRLLIPYLRPGNYWGVEPNDWLVREGIARELGEDVIRVKQPTFSTISDFGLSALGERFDFVMAHSIFTHTFRDMALQGLRGVHDCLADGGMLIATFREHPEPTADEGSGWRYPARVMFTWDQFREIGAQAGLALRLLQWPHPRQRWVVAARDDATADQAAARVNTVDGAAR
jgi:SAM-dependent methyltransferase